MLGQRPDGVLYLFIFNSVLQEDLKERENLLRIYEFGRVTERTERFKLTLPTCAVRLRRLKRELEDIRKEWKKFRRIRLRKTVGKELEEEY